eukprot:7162866-Pyramimonas_sp.AAC.1
MDFLVVDAAARLVEELGGRQIMMPQTSAVRRRRARCRVRASSRPRYKMADRRQTRRTCFLCCGRAGGSGRSPLARSAG